MEKKEVIYHVTEGTFGEGFNEDSIEVTDKVPVGARKIGSKFGAVGEMNYALDVYLSDVDVKQKSTTKAGLNICNARDVFVHLTD